MFKWLDITACMFQPPDFHQQNSEAELRWNEHIDFSSGDIEEYSAITDRLHKYQSKKTLSMADKNEDSRTITNPTFSEDLACEANYLRDSQVAQEFEGPADPQKPRTAVSIPYVVVSKSPPEDAEYTLIYFHANSEDIFKSLRTARLLGKIMRVGCRHF